MKIITACICILFIACTTPGQEKPLNLIGKTIEYRYGESVYHVTLDSDSTLHWEAIAGDEKGFKANETYVAEFISPQKFFITWGEESGIGVSQVLDFEKGKVFNHLLRERVASKGDGQIRIME